MALNHDRWRNRTFIQKRSHKKGSIISIPYIHTSSSKCYFSLNLVQPVMTMGQYMVMVWFTGLAPIMTKKGNSYQRLNPKLFNFSSIFHSPDVGLNPLFTYLSIQLDVRHLISTSQSWIKREAVATLDINQRRKKRENS